jgi:hypothetical protein
MNKENKEKSSFDIDKFNKKYDEINKNRQQLMNAREQAILSKMNTTTFNKKLHEYTIGELAFGLKNTLFDIINDLLNFNLTSDVFTKNNRLFYVGLFINIIVLILYLFQS